MSRILYIFLCVIGITSCAETHKVTGSTSVPLLDGSQLYLKTIVDNEFTTLDSCSVLHGKFEFKHSVDSARMAAIFVGDDNMMPLVLEPAEILVNISSTGQEVTGTELNDSLYSFLDRHARLSNRLNELGHRHSQMILEGYDIDEAAEILNIEAQTIAAEEDVLVTKFISSNYDNVLGPGVFMMLTSSAPYPILTPQIEHIMANATDKFKNNPYVKDYYTTAQANEAQLQGLDTPPSAAQQSDTMAVPASNEVVE